MRTEIGTVLQSRNGKWCITFTSYKGLPGAEYVANEITSAAVFDKEDEAWAGGSRALDYLDRTGMWPNLCEKF